MTQLPINKIQIKQGVVYIGFFLCGLSGGLIIGLLAKPMPWLYIPVLVALGLCAVHASIQRKRLRK